MAIDSARGDRMRRRRQELGLRPVDLAAQCDVSEASVIRWEKGRTMPSRHRGRVEEVLGIRLDGVPQSDEDWARVLRDYRYLHSLLFPQSADGQVNGTAEESVRDEGRIA